MSTEHLVVLLILPVVAMVLIAGWLIYLARGSRPFKLELKGFGLQISVDAASRPNPQPEVE